MAYRKTNPYDRDPGYEESTLDDAIKALNEGRNLDCFPLCSFGWKDADLEPDGCTGIYAIKGMKDKDTYPKLMVEIGGHKTVSPAEEWGIDLPNETLEGYTDILYEMVCDVPWEGYWSGDDWSLHFREIIEVDPVWDESCMELDYAKTAEAIVAAARTKCEEFSRDMRELAADVTNLYDEALKEEAKRKTKREKAL